MGKKRMERRTVLTANRGSTLKTSTNIPKVMSSYFSRHSTWHEKVEGREWEWKRERDVGRGWKRERVKGREWKRESEMAIVCEVEPKSERSEWDWSNNIKVRENRITPTVLYFIIRVTYLESVRTAYSIILVIASIQYHSTCSKLR